MNAANLSDRDHIITLHLSKRLKNLKQSTEEEMKVTYMIDSSSGNKVMTLEN